MGSVPSWVWPNAAMLVAVGGYLWWRLVIGTTRPGSFSHRAGTFLALVVNLLGPIALIGQYALPISARRIVGWPGWPGWLGVAAVARVGLCRLLAHRTHRAGGQRR